MIRINGECYLNVEMDGLTDFNIKIFSNLIIKEVAGVILPVFELHLHQKDYSLYPHLTKVNQIITITYGNNVENAKKYKFRLYNYNYSDADNGFNLIINGIFDAKDFTNVPKIGAFNNTSSEVFNSLTTIKPVINYTGAQDKQVWIQHNIPDKEFVERILKHAYISDDDMVVGALTVDSELIVTSVKTIYGSTPKVVKQDKLDTEKDSIRYDGIRVESDSALWSNFLSEGRSLPVFSCDSGRAIEIIDPKMVSLVDGKSYQDQQNNKNYPIILDNGNCHDGYYKAWVNNLNYGVQLTRNNVYVITSRKFINNDTIKLLDLVEFTPNDSYKTELVDPLSGKYILSEKITQITQKGFSHRLKLNRDYNL